MTKHLIDIAVVRAAWDARKDLTAKDRRTHVYAVLRKWCRSRYLSRINTPTEVRQ